MGERKFRRGDKVQIADDLGPAMRHFRAGHEAIVLYSYADRFGGSQTDSYGIMDCDTGDESAWYYEGQMTLVEHVGEPEIERIIREREARQARERDIDWIFENWPQIRERPPGATMDELMRRIGIADPWGPHGEGFVYMENAQQTIAYLDHALMLCHKQPEGRDYFDRLCEQARRALEGLPAERSG